MTAGLILAGAFVAAVLLVPVVAHAQEREDFNRLSSPRGAERMLGWVAIGAGTVGTGSFMVYSMALRRRVMPPLTTDGKLSSTAANGSAPRWIATIRKPLLNFHVSINLIGFFAGMAHGFFFVRGLDIISLTLAISMAVAVGSGLLLKFGSRRIKFYNFQLHGNISLVLLVVLLTGMHVLSVRGGD